MADGAVVYRATTVVDSSGSVQSLKQIQTGIKEMRSELSAASKQAKQDYQAQSLAAKAVGASQEDLIRITQRYAQTQLAISRTKQQMDTQFVQGNGSVAASNRSVSTTLAEELAAVKALAAAEESRNAHSVSQMQAASAGLRALDGNFTNNIRSAERFTAMIPGMSGLLTAAFPIVGGVAFIAMLGKGAMELYKFREEGVNAGKLIREAYEDLTVSTHKHGVELDLTNDKLDTQLAKINHKPANLLKTALDEDRKAAYDLTEELNRATRAESALMKEKSVGEFKALGMSLLGYNVASTTDQQKLISQQNGDLRRVNKAGDDAMDHADPKNAEKVRQDDRIARQNAYTDAINKTKAALDKVYANQREGKGVDFSSQTSMLEGHLDELEGQAHNLQAGYTAGDKQRDVTRAEEARQRNRDAESASKKSLEAAKHAAEDQRKQWESDAKDAEAGGKVTAQAELQGWIDRANSVKIGTENWRYANDKADADLRKINDDRRKAGEESIKLTELVHAAQSKQIIGVVEKSVAYDNKGTNDQQTTLKALVDAQREATYQQALAQAQQDASLGTISRYDEAVRIQALHTQEYTDRLRELQAQLAAVDGVDAEATAHRNMLQKQITDTNSKAQIESMKDASNTAAQTWQGALTNANAVWVQDSQDSAKQVKELYSSVLGGVNGQLVNLMTGKKADFGSMFRGIGGQLSNMGLQKIEGGLLGKLGMGKADGSKGNPLHVILDTGMSGITSSATSLIPSKGLGNSASSFLSTALGFIPGFSGFRAGGGGVGPGQSVMIGERGPELLTMGSTGGHVTPNHRLPGAFGGASGGDMHVHVYADSNTDIAQVRFQARQGAMEGHAASMRMYGDHYSDSKRRTPASRM